MKKNIQKIEFGDFQTPDELADNVCKVLKLQGINPQSILEPTCGRGSFLIRALHYFEYSKRVIGIDINQNYLEHLRNALQKLNISDVDVRHENFFAVNWKKIISELPEPILIIGNPPWVTNSELGTLNGSNLPVKCNFQQHKGMDAMTGKSNFDISEWMLVHLLQQIQNREAVLAMLCKTSIARKVLKYAWNNQLRISEAAIYNIDANHYFDVSVDACLFVCKTDSTNHYSQTCDVYSELFSNKVSASIGIRDNDLIADMKMYQKWAHFNGEKNCHWRSGIKHDCAEVMELKAENGEYANRQGEIVCLEKELLYPFFKSSDIAKNEVKYPKRWVIVPQKNIGDNTENLRTQSPALWNYLLKHADKLDNRKSSIYKAKPRFSIFGIGSYSFAPWKVAISGLYKTIRFSVVGTYDGKPAMVDDTCYFLPCKSKESAMLVADMLNSPIAKEFLNAFIFWDSKRPITANILSQINLAALAKELGMKNVFNDEDKQIPLSQDMA